MKSKPPTTPNALIDRNLLFDAPRFIETSGNLTNWTAIATNVAPSNIFNYTNSNATNLTRFYRVKDGT